MRFKPVYLRPNFGAIDIAHPGKPLQSAPASQPTLSIHSVETMALAYRITDSNDLCVRDFADNLESAAGHGSYTPSSIAGLLPLIMPEHQTKLNLVIHLNAVWSLLDGAAW